MDRETSLTVLTPSVAMITLECVNIYAIKDAAGVTLVDTGLPGQISDYIQVLSSWDVDFADINRVIVTHAHPHHYGNAAEIEERNNAKIMCHSLDADFIRGEREIPVPVMTERDIAVKQELEQDLCCYHNKPAPYTILPVKRTTLLENDDPLGVLDGIAIHSPGHTYGHLSLWFAQQRLLIAGDAITCYRDAIEPGLFNLTPPQAYRTAYRLCRQYPIDIIAFGHGQPLLSDAQKIMEPQLRRWVKEYFN